MQELNTLIDLLGRPEFLVGLATGSIALLALVLTRAAGSAFWGVAVAAATLITVQLTIGRRLGLALGIALLAVGGWWLGKLVDSGDSPAPAWALLVVGAWLAATRGDVVSSAWIVVSGILVALAAGYAMSQWRGTTRHELVGTLFLITAFGIWTTVPETDSARGLLGVALPLAFATHRWVGGKMSSAGAFALAGIVVWVGATGGAERPASILGAWASLGMLVIFPLFAAQLRRLPSWALVLGHALIVLITARGIGLGENALPALAASAALYGVVFFAIRVYGSTQVLDYDHPEEEEAWN